MKKLQPNPKRKLIIEVGGQKYARYPVKTRLVTPKDKDPAKIVGEYTRGLTQAGDIIFVSEKMVAITQGRAKPVNEIKPSWWAEWLSKHVYRNPAGIGLAAPETMHLAIEEVGLWRILLAASAAAVTKPLGIKGLFYYIAGEQARSIDGPVPYAIPPYNTYASKGPANPEKVAEKISRKINLPVAIVDANDLGVRVLGVSPTPVASSDLRGVNKKIVDKKFIAKAIRDNPLGQCDESTPIGILRKV